MARAKEVKQSVSRGHVHPGLLAAASPRYLFVMLSQVNGNLHYSCSALGTTSTKFLLKSLTAHALWAETCFSLGSSHSLTCCRCGTPATIHSCSWCTSSAALRQLHPCGIAIVNEGAPEGAGIASTSQSSSNQAGR